MRSPLSRACRCVSALLVLALASCAHLRQPAPPEPAVAPRAGKAIKQAGGGNPQTKPSSLPSDRNSEPIQRVSHDEVVPTIALGTAPVPASPAPDSSTGEDAGAEFQPPQP